MLGEAAPTIDVAPGQDLAAYANALLDRFANPALDHRLIQIAMDGSQKIPQLWLETLAWHQARGRRCASLEQAVAAWIAFLRSGVHPIDDPLADQLREAVRGKRSEEHTSELQSLMRISYAVFCLKKKKQ